MKVLLFAESLKNRAGIERMTVELANLLLITYDVTILLIDKFNRAECPFSLYPSVNVSSLNSAFNKPFHSFDLLNIRNIYLFRKQIKDIKPDVLITVATPLVRISAIGILGLKIKHIAWEHFNLSAGSYLGSIYKKISTRFVDGTVVLSEADKMAFEKGNSAKIFFIPNFTSIGKFYSEKVERKHILLAVGRHAQQKGFDLLLNAWAKVVAPGWKLRIVGSGEEFESNVLLSNQLGIADSVEFLPNTSNISQEFLSASCFVLSSRYEGLVLVLIEAKSLGLPCISFDCPHSPREVIRDGVDGWLVSDGDIDKLAECITDKLSHPSVLITAGEESRKDALARYSPNAVFSQWNRLIQTL